MSGSSSMHEGGMKCIHFSRKLTFRALLGLSVDERTILK
jgi:hypothetical protein